MKTSLMKKILPDIIIELYQDIKYKYEIKESNVVKDMLEDLENYSESFIQNYQKNKLINLLKYSYFHTEYYRDLFLKHGILIDGMENFKNIPFLDKDTIRKNKQKIISDETSMKNFYKMNTGGSTGEPLEFIVSSLAGLVDKVHQEYQYNLMGVGRGDLIIAFDGSTVPEKLRKKNVYWIKRQHKNSMPYGSVSFSSLYLTDYNINYYIDHLFKLKPAILRGYPSFISELAEYILENHIEVNFNIKGIQLTSEMVYEFQVTNICKAFKTKVYMQYGHSEVSIFAYTLDDSMKYYCSPFYGYTEVINESSDHVKEGEIGEIVVTGFNNYMMPFIRYRTGDLAVYGGQKNGLVCLERIEGRTQDFVYGLRGKKTALTALIFGQHYSSFKNIKKWQLVQNKLGLLDIKIIPNSSFNEMDKLEIVSKFRNIANIEVEFDYVSEIETTNRGKQKFLIQNIK